MKCGRNRPQPHHQQQLQGQRRAQLDVAAAASHPGPSEGGGASVWTPPARVSRSGRSLPEVDWRRYHLQVLFVDRTDTIRARLAAGLFERIAEWNGYSRVLLPTATGVEAGFRSSSGITTSGSTSSSSDSEPAAASSSGVGDDSGGGVSGGGDGDGGGGGGGGSPAWSITAALTSQAVRLKIRPKLFTAPPDQLVREDLDRFDIIVAIDDDLQQQVMALLDPQDPYDRQWWQYYEDRVCSLTSFSDYASPDTLLRVRGGFALLSSELKAMVAPLIDPPIEPMVQPLEEPVVEPGEGQRQQEQEQGQEPTSGSLVEAQEEQRHPKQEQEPARSGEGSSGYTNFIVGGAGKVVARSASASPAGKVEEEAGSSSSGGRGPDDDGGGTLVLTRISADLGGSVEEWDKAVMSVLLCCAGLVKYLIDAYPPDLPEYDPVD